jgi:hypothetical protein
MMSSRSSVSEPVYLGIITVVALTIAIIVAGEINLLNYCQDLGLGEAAGPV